MPLPSLSTTCNALYTAGSKCCSIAKSAAVLGAKIASLEVIKQVDWKIEAYAMQELGSRGICLLKILEAAPSELRQSLRWTAKHIMTFKNETCTALSVQPKSVACLALGGVIEEVAFRYLFQEVILRKLPQKALEKFFPVYAEAVDSMPMKISRVALSSLFFTYLHQSPFFMDCATQGITAIMVRALFFSLLQEITQNSLYPIYAHTSMNLGIDEKIGALYFFRA